MEDPCIAYFYQKKKQAWDVLHGKKASDISTKVLVLLEFS